MFVCSADMRDTSVFMFLPQAMKLGKTTPKPAREVHPQLRPFVSLFKRALVYAQAEDGLGESRTKRDSPTKRDDPPVRGVCE